MGVSRQEYWSGLPFPSPGDLPDTEIEPESLMPPALSGGFFTTNATWKRSVFVPIPKKGNAKECSNYLTIALISHASKIMLKILQAGLQQYVIQQMLAI